MIRFFTLLALAFASAIGAASADPSFSVPNNSNYAPGGSPVEIESCTTGRQGGLIISQTDGSFRVVFTNEGSTTADLIRFQIDLGGERLFIRDVGTYSPGVTVTHVFNRRGGNVVTSALFNPAPFTCNVAAVHFVDGSNWTPPTAASLEAHAQADQLHILGDGFIGIQYARTSQEPMIRFVIPSGPAAQGGLTQGDVIRQIDGQNVDTTSDVTSLVSATPVGTSLSVTVDRGGQPLTLHVIVGRRPESATQR